VHFPPWQLVEQHALPVAQVSPSVLQELVPEGVGIGWQVVEQRPVQHWSPELQAFPVDLQVVFAHRPATHDSEQHSLASVQAPPGALQNAVVVQVPEDWPLAMLQAAEQHCALPLQVAPEPRQVETGSAHCCVTGLQ
jgi:hypothetical protein